MRLFGIFTIVPALVAFYGSYTWLFHFFKEKQFKSFVLRAFLLLLCSLSITTAAVTVFAGRDLIVQKPWNVIVEIETILLVLTLIHGTLGLILRGFLQWYDDIKWKERLAQQHFETELALVKSQLDPHFLFNTLNNIDILIEKNPQKASSFLNKLSEIMRFMLYETKTDTIPLSKEIAYIEKYIALQKIRTANPEFVHFDASEATHPHAIAPMLFIPFIENAFKHSPPLKTGTAIDIQIRTEPNQIIFMCKNRVKHAFSDQNNSERNNPANSDTDGGIGEKLITKRLALLYPNQHKLTFNMQNDWYEARLTVTSQP